MSEADPEGDPEPPEPRPENPGRRRALGALVVAGSAAYGVALCVPAGRFLVPALSAAGDKRWIRVARRGALREGEAPLRAKVVGDERDAFTVTTAQTLGSVWLQKRDGKVVALSAECPHLGCAVDLGGDGQSFACPCHASRFELGGNAASGPSPRAMDELETRVVDDWIEVAFARFRQGVPEKAPV